MNMHTKHAIVYNALPITGKAVFYNAIQVSTMATYMYFNETRPHAMQYTSCNALTQC